MECAFTIVAPIKQVTYTKVTQTKEPMAIVKLVPRKNKVISVIFFTGQVQFLQNNSLIKQVTADQIDLNPWMYVKGEISQNTYKTSDGSTRSEVTLIARQFIVFNKNAEDTLSVLDSLVKSEDEEYENVIY